MEFLNALSSCFHFGALTKTWEHGQDCRYELRVTILPGREREAVDVAALRKLLELLLDKR